MDIDQLCNNFDPWSKELATDTHLFWSIIQRMRDKGPLLHSDAHGGFWIITNHDAVMQANRDWEAFSSAHGVSIPHNPDAPLLAPIEVDPPEHRDWRRLLNPLMSPPAVAKHESAMRRIAVGLMDEFVEYGECDLSADFAWKFVPSSLFQLLLGVPAEDVPFTRELAHSIVSHGSAEQEKQAFADLSGWARGFLKWRETQPEQGDVIDALMGGQIGRQRLTQEEMVPAVILLIVAGMDTTSNSIGDIAMHLIDDLTLQELFRGDEAPVEMAIEELLRHGSISFGLSRVTTRDVEVAGQMIPAGERVFLLWAAANRDPSVFRQPEQFDITRKPNPHLAFGAGPHRCMGAAFARLMLKVAVTEIATRMPELRLRPGATVERPPGLVRSIRSMPVLFRPTPRSATAVVIP